MEEFQNIKFTKFGEDPQPVFWGHGWGQSHSSFTALAEPLKNLGTHHLIDFPGFGDSGVPGEIWGTKDYADKIAELIRSQTDRKIIWVGHSFGCRVGLQLAAHYPDLIDRMILIAAAGLKRKRPLHKKIYIAARISLFKTLKKLIPFGLSKGWLYKIFASPDYANAGPMRQVFIKVVNEDLTDIAQQITCPVLLVFGENDTETPPEMGQRLSGLIPNAELVLLDNQDHYSVLNEGRHQVIKLIKDFINLSGKSRK